MSSIGVTQPLSSIQNDFAKIDRNEKWIQTADKVELALLGGVFIGIIGLAIASCIIGTDASLMTQSIAILSTLGGVSAPSILSGLIVKYVRTHLDSQNQQLRENFNGKRFLEGALDALETDEIKAQEHLEPLLKKMTDTNWTQFIQALDSAFSKKESLADHEKTLLELLEPYTSQISENLFFISEQTMEHLLNSLSLQTKVGSSLDFICDTYFRSANSKFRNTDSYLNFLGSLVSAFGGGKPAVWIKMLEDDELQAQEAVCIQGMQNLSRTLAKIVPHNEKAQMLLRVWQDRPIYFKFPMEMVSGRALLHGMLERYYFEGKEADLSIMTDRMEKKDWTKLIEASDTYFSNRKELKEHETAFLDAFQVELLSPRESH